MNANGIENERRSVRVKSLGRDNVIGKETRYRYLMDSSGKKQAGKKDKEGLGDKQIRSSKREIKRRNSKAGKLGLDIEGRKRQ